MMPHGMNYCFCMLLVMFLISCHSDSEISTETQIARFELVDPSPGSGDRFGEFIAVSVNGNIVVSDPLDSSIAQYNGAIHIYNPFTRLLVRSIYGEDRNDSLGSDGVLALPNGNFLILSHFDNVDGAATAGSVRLIDGETGLMIGSAITGDNPGDHVGWRNSVTVLDSGNFVVVSMDDTVGGVESAGSVRVFNSDTGVQVGSDIAGDSFQDQLGLEGIRVLANGNFVIASPYDDVSGIVNAGSVTLVSGLTGNVISSINGDQSEGYLGGHHITPLKNGHFVIASASDDIEGIDRAGSVRLIDGTTGLQIGSTFSGDMDDDRISYSGLEALPSGDFVVASALDNENGIFDTGSVRLFDGFSGAPIGVAITGENAGDEVGLEGIAVLNNNNYVIISGRDQINSMSLGSVMLIDGATGVQIGNAITGNTEFDFISSSVTVLTNDNFVVSAYGYNGNGIVRTGAAILVNGSTSEEISRLYGDMAEDQIGFGGVYALSNGNYVLLSPSDSEAGLTDAGSIRLMHGGTGAQIGSSIRGDVSNDFLGSHGLLELPNGNFLVLSRVDDENGIVDAGSLRIISGVTGNELENSITGLVSEDMPVVGIHWFRSNVAISNEFDFFVFSQPDADNYGMTDSGRVLLTGF